MNFLLYIRMFVMRIMFIYRFIKPVLKYLKSPLLILLAIGAVAVFLLIKYYPYFRLGKLSALPVILIISGVFLICMIVYFFFFFNREKSHEEPEVADEVIEDEEDLTEKSNIKIKDVALEFKNIISFFKKKKQDINLTPLILAVGSEGSGKTALIENSKLHFIDANIITRKEEEDINWYIAPETIIVDVKGKSFLDKDNKVFSKTAKLLFKKRKLAPINNIVLTISAEDLILFEEETIRKAAITVLDAFERVHKTAKIKPPIYVVITKSDLINGFEEFFQNIPSLKNDGILGFDISKEHTEAKSLSKAAEKSIASFVEDIYAKRLNLLCDKKLSHSELLSKIYSFPVEFEKIAEKLCLYIKTLIVENKLREGQDLFLRGIYFTSVEQKADRLNIPLQNTSFASILTLKRKKDARLKKSGALFVSDLLLEKIIREKSLAKQTTQRIFYNRMARYTTYILSLVVLVLVLVLLFVGKNSLKEKLDNEQPIWENAVKFDAKNPVLLKESGGNFYYDAERMVNGVPCYLFNYKLSNLAAKPVDVPLIFKPAYFFSNINMLRLEKARQTFDSSILNPLFTYVGRKFASDMELGKTENADIKRIVVNVIHLRADCLDKETGVFNSRHSLSTGPGDSIDLELWFKYLLDNEQNQGAWKNYLNIRGGDNPQESVYQKTFNNLYNARAAGWPPGSFCDVLNYIQSKPASAFTVLAKSFIDNYAEYFLSDSKNLLEINKAEAKFKKEFEVELNEYRENNAAYINSMSVIESQKLDKIWDKLFGALYKLYNLHKSKIELCSFFNKIYKKDISPDELDEVNWGKLKYEYSEDDYIRDMWNVLALNPGLAVNPGAAKRLNKNQYLYYRIITDTINAQLNSKTGNAGKRIKGIHNSLISLYGFVKLENMIKKMGKSDSAAFLKLKNDFTSSVNLKNSEIIDFMYHLQVGIKEYDLLMASFTDFSNLVKDERVGENSVDRIPEIPFSSLEDKGVDKHYSRRTLDDIITKWRKIEKNYKEAAQAIDKQGLDDAWLRTNIAYKEYLFQYYSYWNNILTAAEAKTLPWEYYSKHIADDQAWLINHKLETLYDVALTAMEELSGAYDKKDFPERVAKKIQSLKQSIQQINDETVSQKTAAILKYWRAVFYESPVAARNMILGRSYNQFLDAGVFPLGKPDPSAFSIYWHSLSYSFLDSLSNAVEPLVINGVKETIENAQFPFSIRTRSKQMTKDDCTTLIKKLNTLLAPSKMFDKGDLGNLTTTQLNMLDIQLANRIKSLRVKLSPGVNAWVENARKLYDALAADKFNFSTRVVLVGADAQVTDDMGCYVWPAIRIKQAGSGEKFPLTMTRTEKNTSLGKVFCPGGKFEIDLYRNSKELGDDVPDVKVEIPDNWSVFNFLVDGPERFLDFNPEFWFSWDAARFDKENSIWESRLTLSSLDGRKLYFDIMFKLPEGVACIRNWRSILEEIGNDNRSEKVI